MLADLNLNLRAVMHWQRIRVGHGSRLLRLVFQKDGTLRITCEVPKGEVSSTGGLRPVKLVDDSRF